MVAFKAGKKYNANILCALHFFLERFMIYKLSLTVYHRAGFYRNQRILIVFVKEKWRNSVNR